jgi:hypothetical protein
MRKTVRAKDLLADTESELPEQAASRQLLSEAIERLPEHAATARS